MDDLTLDERLSALDGERLYTDATEALIAIFLVANDAAVKVVDELTLALTVAREMLGETTDKL